MLSAILAAALWIGPAQSGSWFTPERSGEGFTLQVLENGSAVALWFTYPPPGSSAAQAWIYADSGRVEGDRIRFANAFTTRGPRFGAGYDATQLRLLPWGTLEFRFTACNEGEVTYAGPAAWGSGSRRVTRLTALSELECAGKRRLGAGGARTLEGVRQRSGSWFDPAHNGEGWTVEELPDGRALVYWFTYDAQGEQAWMVGEAPAHGARVVVESNLRPVGTRFGAAFDPAQVQRVPWGTLEFEFSDCNTGVASYTSTQSQFGSGTLRPVRLSTVAGTTCVDGTPTAPVNGTWSAAAPMPVSVSEIATTVHGDHAYVAGGIADFTAFMRFDLTRGTWEMLPRMPRGRHHALAFTISDHVYVAGGFPTGSGNRGEGNRYSVSQGIWEDALALPVVAASGAATLAGYAWLGDMDGSLTQYDPRTGASRVHVGDGRGPRDHSQLVAFQGELWMLGGRQQLVSESQRVSIFDPASETWREGPALRIARAGFAAAASSSMIMVAGGEVLANGLRTLSSVEAIMAGQQAWSALPPLPLAVHGVGGVLRGNAFFALGGSTRAGSATNPGAVQVYRWP